MKAYVGIDETRGRYYAVAELPQAVQYGATPEEAWAKLDAYLREHHNMALTPWRPFPKPVVEVESK